MLKSNKIIKSANQQKVFRTTFNLHFSQKQNILSISSELTITDKLSNSV